MLINCPECNLQVSDKAFDCPHCGYPLMPESKRPPARRKSNRRRRLPNGFGQISEIKNRNLRKPFRAMVTVGKDKDGKPISKPLKPDAYFSTYNDAYQALVEYNKNPYDLSPSITVKELYEKWSVEYFKTFKSVKSEQATKRAWRYCSSIYNMRVLDLRARHIKFCIEEGTSMVGNAEKKANAKTKTLIKSLFNKMLDYAVEYELVDRNYARTFTLSEDIVKETQIVKKQHLSFSDSEINLLWNNLNNKYGVHFILVQCYSGWRPQELGLIKLEDVDLKNWTFRGGIKTEAGENRIVPIHSRIRDIVSKEYEQALSLGSKYLFNYVSDNRLDKNTELTYRRYSMVFDRVCQDLHFDMDHRPHDGRKHFVTKCKEAGVDEYAIKYIVGHKISDITEKTYTDRKFEWLQQEIEKIK